MGNKKSDKNLHRIIADTGQVASKWPQIYNDTGPPEEMCLQLADDSGFFFGGLNQFGSDSYIGMPSGAEGHIIVVGSSGSCKSAGIVKPTLMTWGGTICATDIKGELSQCYEAFSDALFRMGIITCPHIVFDPTQADGPAYDPFWWPAKDDKANLISNIDEIALAIIPPLATEKEPFWTDTERAVLSAALLHYFGLGLSFSETMCRILKLNLSTLCAELTESTDIRVKMRLGEIADAEHLDSKMLVGVDRGLRNKIELFATDPFISHAFRGERENAACFNWDDLNRCHIFLRIPAYRVETWGRAINLMYTQLIRYLERRPEKYSVQGSRNPPILLMLDEFAQFGRLEIITSAMSTLRSKNVNICLVVQSMAQLDSVYGENGRRILFDNTRYLALLQANDSETQKWFAERIGTKIHYQSSAGKQLDASMEITGYSTQLNESREWTIFPHELSTLEDVLLLSPYGLSRLEKFCFKEKIWQQLLSSMRRQYLALQQNVRASILDPITPDTLESVEIVNIVNKDAIMLTIGERTANADRQVEEALRQKPSATKDDLTAEAGKGLCFSRAIGDLLLQQFPEILDLEPGFKQEEADWSKPLEKVLAELTDDQRAIENLKRGASWPTHQ